MGQTDPKVRARLAEWRRRDFPPVGEVSGSMFERGKPEPKYRPPVSSRNTFDIHTGYRRNPSLTKAGHLRKNPQVVKPGPSGPFKGAPTGALPYTHKGVVVNSDGFATSGPYHRPKVVCNPNGYKPGKPRPRPVAA